MVIGLLVSSYFKGGFFEHFSKRPNFWAPERTKNHEGPSTPGRNAKFANEHELSFKTKSLYRYHIVRNGRQPQLIND